MLFVSRRRFGAFSHTSPPCMVVRDHVDRGGDLDPVVDRGQQEGLGAAAGGAGGRRGGSRRRRAATPGSPPSGCCSTGGAPATRSPTGRELRVEEAVVDLARVVVADHVVREDHVALAGEGDAARRDRSVGAVLEAAVGPVAVRGEDAREGTGLPHRPVEVAGRRRSPGGSRSRPSRPSSRPARRGRRPARGAGPSPASARARRSRAPARAGSAPGRATPPRLAGAAKPYGRVQGADLDRPAVDSGDRLVLRPGGGRRDEQGCEKPQRARLPAALHERPPEPPRGLRRYSTTAPPRAGRRRDRVPLPRGGAGVPDREPGVGPPETLLHPGPEGLVGGPARPRADQPRRGGRPPPPGGRRARARTRAGRRSRLPVPARTRRPRLRSRERRGRRDRGAPRGAGPAARGRRPPAPARRRSFRSTTARACGARCD